jgi:hypothetical protein
MKRQGSHLWGAQLCQQNYVNKTFEVKWVRFLSEGEIKQTSVY